MPIIPKVPTPTFADIDNAVGNFNSVQGVTIVGAFHKLFTRIPATTLTIVEVEQVFNNQEAIIAP